MQFAVNPRPQSRFSLFPKLGALANKARLLAVREGGGGGVGGMVSFSKPGRRHESLFRKICYKTQIISRGKLSRSRDKNFDIICL